MNRASSSSICFGLDGSDLRYLSLAERKLSLRKILPKSSERLLYCGHVERDGEALFRLACENDLEGHYREGKVCSLPTGNPMAQNSGYSQWTGRAELFERERADDPDMKIWDCCVRACV